MSLYRELNDEAVMAMIEPHEVAHWNNFVYLNPNRWRQAELDVNASGQQFRSMKDLSLAVQMDVRNQFDTYLKMNLILEASGEIVPKKCGYIDKEQITPPAQFLIKVLKFVYPNRTFERFLAPLIAEEQIEFESASTNKRKWIKVRVWLRVGYSLFLLLPKTFVDGIRGIVSS